MEGYHALCQAAALELQAEGLLSMLADKAQLKVPVFQEMRRDREKSGLASHYCCRKSIQACLLQTHTFITLFPIAQKPKNKAYWLK